MVSLPKTQNEISGLGKGNSIKKMPSRVNKILGCFKPSSRDPGRRASIDLEKQLATWSKTYNKAIKILLLGAGESGKTTIIKQMKILHFEGFSQSERLAMAREIRANVLECIVLITKQMTRFGIPLRNGHNSQSFEYISNIDLEQDFEYSQEFFQHVRNLWEDSGIHECYTRGSSYLLPDCAKYFLDRVSQVANHDYIPSDEDILHSRRTTTEIQKIEFQMKVPRKYGGGFQNFWMFDVGGQKGERRKWIQVFDGIHSILFLVACNVYDQFTAEDPTLNRLQESINLFKDIWNSRFLQESGFIVFLNKQDLLKQKVESGVSIAETFPEYYDYTTSTSQHGSMATEPENNNNEYIRTRSFIKDLFWNAKETPTFQPVRKMSYTPALALTHHHHHLENAQVQRVKQCYWHFTTATDTNKIQMVFEDVHHMIINQNLEMLGLT